MIMPRLSFIIVALNAEKVLQYSLRSLEQQDYPHNQIEVILIDSGSSDNTKNMMKSFKDNNTSFDRVIILDNPRKYLACGWNVALKEVKGDIVLRVDAHTKFPNDFISKNIEIIEDGKDICGGKIESILQNDTDWNRTLLAAENSMFGGGFSFFRRGEIAKYTNTLAFAAYKKKVFDVAGLYDERLVRTEDNEMHYRMRKAGFKFYFSPDIVSYRFCRSSLRGLFRQKFLNGYWVGLTHAVSPKAFSVFYLAPLLFVLVLLVLIGLITISTIPLLAFVSIYLLILIFAVISSIRHDGFHISLLMLPIIILGLHLCYGIGTAKGLCDEDLKMRKIFNGNMSSLQKTVYWLLELVLLPFKTIGWICLLTLGRS